MKLILIGIALLLGGCTAAGLGALQGLGEGMQQVPAAPVQPVNCISYKVGNITKVNCQ